MAKFTVYFKDKAIKSYYFDLGVIRIGRDETNDIVIDNLAIAPAHAVVVIKENTFVIKQLNNEFPLIINKEETKETLLQNNDIIFIAKHTILFNSAESINNVNSNISPETETKEQESFSQDLEDFTNTLNGNLQVMDGPHIGRTIALKKPITKFGQSGAEAVLFSKRKDGYYISTQGPHSNVTINQKPIADKAVILNNNDIIHIDKLSMQFFLKN